uniref:glutathione binding-like protein n=1 Tax=Rhodoferax sp. TaxID=50421 RepID=UPI0025D25F77
DPNIATALDFMEAHLERHVWFAGQQLSIADFQMSFAVEAALARGAEAARFPRLAAYKARMTARPAYQRAVAKGGPVMMS